MLSSTLCWFMGALLLTVGVLASLYLVWLQVRRGVTGFSLLATSDALATVAISITFLLNVSDNDNDTERTNMVCICNYIQHISTLWNESTSYMSIHDNYLVIGLMFNTTNTQIPPPHRTWTTSLRFTSSQTVSWDPICYPPISFLVFQVYTFQDVSQFLIQFLFLSLDQHAQPSVPSWM